MRGSGFAPLRNRSYKPDGAKAGSLAILVAYRHAEAHRRADRNVAEGDSADQGSEPPIPARWQEDFRRSSGS